MDDYYCKRSGQIQVQIPAFGDWDKANDLPITQYFASARQAGLIRYSSSSGETVPSVGPGDLYAVDMRKPSAVAPSRKQKTRVREKRHTHVNGKEKIYNSNEKEPPRKPILPKEKSQPLHVRPPRPPVDEDLYKIPPQLLHNSKRSKRRGLFSRCLVPACNS